MARDPKTILPTGKKSAKRHLAPRAGRGRPAIGRAGEGELQHRNAHEAAPHPDLLPASGEKEPSALRGGRLGSNGKESVALYRLMAWLSPAYPVGAFSYSGGIEWAVEAGEIANACTLKNWIVSTLTEGGCFCDAVFFIHTHVAVSRNDSEALRAIAELAAAFAPSKERHLETTAQGRAFIEATRAAWPCDALETLAIAWGGPVAYPVAVAVACAGHGIALEQALSAYLHAVAANQISAGVRLIPLGQTDGLHVLAALEPTIAVTAERALKTPLEEIGSATLRADTASMKHETQYTRLFRS